MGQPRRHSRLDARTQLRTSLGPLYATFLVAFVSLILLLPGGEGITPSASTVLSPPYAGAVLTPHTSRSTTGCGHTALVSPEFFNGTSGRAGFAANTSATNCNATNDEGTVEFIPVMHVPVRLSGHHVQIVITGTVNSTSSVSVAAGRCHDNVTTRASYCYVSAATDLNGNASLLDTTNHSQWSSAHSWSGPEEVVYSLIDCTSAGCSNRTGGPSGVFASSLTFSLSINATGLLSTHSYLLFFSFDASVESSILALFGSSLTGASARASLDVARGGNGISVSSITIR